MLPAKAHNLGAHWLFYRQIVLYCRIKNCILKQNDAISVTLFSFDKNEEISTHSASGDAFVTCLDGACVITVDGIPYELHREESIVMPAGHPHAVFAKERFKMLLVVVK